MVSMRSSITLKIALLVLGSTCLVLALVLVRSYTNSRELIRQEAEIAARNLTSSLAHEIEKEFLLVAKAAGDLASFLETGQWDDETLLNQIKCMVKHNEKVYGSAVAFLPFRFKPGVERYCPYFYRSDEGIVFEQLGTPAYDYLSKDWFRIPAETGKGEWSKPYFDEGGGNVVMTTYSHPMFRNGTDGSDRRLVAIVTADISLIRLNDLVNAKRVYDSGFCFVVSDKGTLITSRQPERIMRLSVFDIVRMYEQPRGPEIARALVGNEQGYQDIGSALTGTDSYLAFRRINPPGWTLGTVLPKNELFAKVDSLHKETVVLAAWGIVLLLAAAVLVARSISRPLKRMAGETVKVSEGDLDIDLSEIKTTDEVGQLARAFVRMTEGLKDRERIKDTFGRYLTQEVVKRLLESEEGLKLGGENREISILMSDLRGFTALTSSMTPEQVIKFLNRYLGKMVEVILDYHGIIDEIIGDGILAFFGAPETLENHPELAVACALKMQIAMEEINAMNEADGLPHLEMGVAVNTGRVIVGNIGSEKRAKYGAVGAQVNFTGRVESFTVGGQILISRATYENLSEKLIVRNVLDVEMKGVPGKERIYDVRGIRGDHEANLRERDETLIPLTGEIEVQVYGMREKILQGKGRGAAITHASLLAAKVKFDSEARLWEDIRMIPKGTSLGKTGVEIYGKIISLESSDQEMVAIVRFTSVPAEAYKMLRGLLGSPGASRKIG